MRCYGILYPGLQIHIDTNILLLYHILSLVIVQLMCILLQAAVIDDKSTCIL